ncbi:MAG: OprO/OprP family phosphate-selective porin [Candidatus Marinimicrobia bacterium]|nr:OprO/OprP family phosphate-selective porin [Candidatus Neomarinimicrobiota bacterium]MCF7830236.1 OprO/OprP family phosphate-selective porin [Candidatus Neomarinimicrobiota bacterium]MCF7882263.1 OprO/OprP family phosphate-selective porin [Candidatus Neomarinimicrobiota bacterium]
MKSAARILVKWVILSFLLVPVFALGQDVGLSGRIYTGYFYNTHTNNNAFTVDRVYLGYAGDLTSDVSYNVTSDIGPDFTDGGYQLFMKYAYIDWRQGDAGGLILGMIPMNAYDVQKRTWGFRYLRKTVMNDRGFAPSADIGAGYEMRFSRKVLVSAALSNGEGYKSPEVDEYKRIHVRLLYGPENLGSTTGFNVGAYTSYEAENVDESRMTFAGFTGIHVNDMWAGLEGAYQMLSETDWNQLLLSVYGRMEVGEDATAFGRFDYSNEQNPVTEITENLIIGGVEFNPTGGIKIAPNFVYSLEDDGEDDLAIRASCEFRW